MAATHYQIFYRYVSPDTNVPITNDLSNAYEETLEIVHQKHKLYAGTTEEQQEAEQDLNNMIIEQTTPATCSKYDMMFAFNGAKKYYHRNWKAGKWSSEILAIPDGVVQLKEYGGDQILHEYKTKDGYTLLVYNEDTTPLPYTTTNVTAENYDFKNSKGQYCRYNGYIVPGNIPKLYTAGGSKVFDHVVDETELESAEELPDINPNKFTITTSGNDVPEGGCLVTWKAGEYQIWKGSMASNGLGNFDKMRTDNIVQIRIDNGMAVDRIRPTSYGMMHDCAYPYVVKDSYLRIPMSPWIKGSTCGSLEAAIEKCRTLVGMIGMENVKLVKIVDIRQKIRIN